MNTDVESVPSTGERVVWKPTGRNSMGLNLFLAQSSRGLGVAGTVLALFQTISVVGTSSPLNTPEVHALVLGSGLFTLLFGAWFYHDTCKSAYPVIMEGGIKILESSLRRPSPLITLSRAEIARIELTSSPFPPFTDWPGRQDLDYQLLIELLSGERIERNYFAGSKRSTKELESFSTTIQSWANKDSERDAP